MSVHNNSQLEHKSPNRVSPLEVSVVTVLAVGALTLLALALTTHIGGNALTGLGHGKMVTCFVISGSVLTGLALHALFRIANHQEPKRPLDLGSRRSSLTASEDSLPAWNQVSLQNVHSLPQELAEDTLYILTTEPKIVTTAGEYGVAEFAALPNLEQSALEENQYTLLQSNYQVFIAYVEEGSFHGSRMVSNPVLKYEALDENNGSFLMNRERFVPFNAATMVAPVQRELSPPPGLPRSPNTPFQQQSAQRSPSQEPGREISTPTDELEVRAGQVRDAATDEISDRSRASTPGAVLPIIGEEGPEAYDQSIVDSLQQGQGYFYLSVGVCKLRIDQGEDDAIVLTLPAVDPRFIDETKCYGLEDGQFILYTDTTTGLPTQVYTYQEEDSDQIVLEHHSEFTNYGLSVIAENSDKQVIDLTPYYTGCVAFGDGYSEAFLAQVPKNMAYFAWNNEQWELRMNGSRELVVVEEKIDCQLNVEAVREQLEANNYFLYVHDDDTDLDLHLVYRSGNEIQDVRFETAEQLALVNEMRRVEPKDEFFVDISEAGSATPTQQLNNDEMAVDE